MNRYLAKNFPFAGLAILMILLSNRVPAIGGTAKFTASAPPGGTNFPSAVGFSVAVSGGDSFSSELIDFAAGVSGSNVVNEMESRMETASSVEGNVSGNMLTVNNVSVAAVHGGGGGLDIWLDIDTMLDPCRNCMLDLDFAIPFEPPHHTFRTVKLLLGGPDGQAVPIQFEGTLSLAIEIADDANSPVTSWNFENAWPYDLSMTTDDLIQAIDTSLQTTSLPSGIKYVGLEGGFPTIGHDISLRILSVRFSNDIPDGSEADFLVGAAAIGMIPEPTSVMLALLAISIIGCAKLRTYSKTVYGEGDSSGIGP